MKDGTALVAMVWLVAVCFAVVVIGGVWTSVTRDTYPESTEDCPPGHVYIDYGETPQAGCWPEGVAREIGVWPKPEGE